MAKFNRKTPQAKKVENRAGGQAFAQSDELALVSHLLSSFMKEQHYRSGDAALKDLRGLIAKVDPLFAAKAALYARNVFGMRSVSHVVAGELANSVKGKAWMRPFIANVVRRVDDMTEILSYFGNTYGAPLPNSLKYGLRKAFDKFDGYQLAKYKASGQEVSLVDLVNLVHPVPTEKNAEALKLLVKGELKNTQTREAMLSAAGQQENKEEAKKDAWRLLLQERKIGYFALLKNLRNILQQAPELTKDACALLTDTNLIKKSLVLPFRFYSAYKELYNEEGGEARQMLAAIATACDLSCANVPVFEGKTLVAIDVSGSMQGAPITNAALLGAVFAKHNNADIMVFSDHAGMAQYDPTLPALTLAQNIIDKASFGGTDFNTIFSTKVAYDRIVILSDMQAWIGYWSPTQTFNHYKKTTGANPQVITVDLAGYGDMQFPENNVVALAGFSEKIFDLMKMIEGGGRDLLVKTIKDYPL